MRTQLPSPWHLPSPASDLLASDSNFSGGEDGKEQVLGLQTWLLGLETPRNEAAKHSSEGSRTSRPSDSDSSREGRRSRLGVNTRWVEQLRRFWQQSDVREACPSACFASENGVQGPKKRRILSRTAGDAWFSHCFRIDFHRFHRISIGRELKKLGAMGAYEVGSFEGRGLGLRALRRLAAGETILEERSLSSVKTLMLLSGVVVYRREKALRASERLEEPFKSI